MDKTSVVENTRSPGEHIYSDKIKERRRALFPYSEPSDMEVDANPLNLNAECTEYQNIANIPSTEYIRKLLGTPERKIITTDIDVSPSRNTDDQDSISSLSLAEILETPNDSFTHTEEAPRISRKSMSGASAKDEPCSNSNKPSKVRTTLFSEIDITVPTKQFYKSTEPSVNKRKTPVSAPQPRTAAKSKIKRAQSRKKLFGQINAGVRHKIRRKSDISQKISKVSVSQIKTYKSDLTVNSNFNEFMKDLEEINENKKVKLIQNMPDRGQSKISENKESISLKRPRDKTENISFKKFRSSEPELKVSSEENSFDNELEDEIKLPIENILSTLDKSFGEDKENKSRDKGGILSPSVELSNMTLGLKLCSPKKVKNLTTVFQNMADSNTLTPSESEQKQYYPLFYPQKRPAEKVLEKECSNKKKKIKLSSDQMLLDAGQKKFGLLECAECNYVYNAGDPNDEDLHEKHHHAINILQFNGWKHERIVDKGDGRIIKILPGDSRQWIDKVKRISEFINRELGYHGMEVDLSGIMVFLYIFNKSIIGCVMAESRTSANKILTSNIDVDLCSLEEYPVACGVSRLWIAPSYRKKGIATKLMETLRKNFLPDRVIERSEIALSAPTPDGKLFATKYFGTPNFFTYLN